MVLPDDTHGARLLALLALALVQRKAHFGADLQLIEFSADEAVAVEIDLLIVAGRADKPVVREELGYGPVGGRLVLLDDAPLSANAILETAFRRIEGVAHRDVGILMSVMPGGIACHRNLAFREHEVNADVIEPALALMAMMGVDDDMAAGKPWMKPLQRRGALPDARFDRLGGGHVAKSDL